MVSSSNPKGDVTINYPDIAALLLQILLFAPRMPPLMHIDTYVNEIAAQRWSNRGSVSTYSSVGPILRELALATMIQHIHTYVGRVPGEENKMADAAPRITHLLDRKFHSHFRSHFPQSKPWHLLPLSSEYKGQLTTILLNKKSPRVYWPPSSRKTPPPCANGSASADDCKPLPTSRKFRTQFRFFKFSPSTPVLDFYPHKGNLSRSDQLSNTSD